jgi:hypothetical protein
VASGLVRAVDLSAGDAGLERTGAARSNVVTRLIAGGTYLSRNKMQPIPRRRITPCTSRRRGGGATLIRRAGDEAVKDAITVGIEAGDLVQVVDAGDWGDLDAILELLSQIAPESDIGGASDP